MKRILIIVLGLIVSLSACNPETGIEVRDAWARPAAQGGNGAVYFVIENHLPETQEMIRVTSDLAEAVEMHESTMSGDVMQMRQLESISLEPDSAVVLEPGALHIMLVGLKKELQVGDNIEVTLQFRSFEDIKVTVPVKDAPMLEENH